ncbi:MAG: hypothetical protein J5739_04655 [Lachnospiraceae bacterium]|nr:hypothetical protein [Lachnospiraceae bacterium]
MLTIKTNMNFKSLMPIRPAADTFSAKIIGDYELMRADFEPEELLHLVSTPPEIYYSEGPTNSFITDNRAITNQNIKLDVINNMINRIMFSGTVKPTYRDTVYVENVLRKLGVTDVKQFLRQVSLIENEEAATEKLLELYHDSSVELRMIARAAAEEGKKKRKGSKKEEEPPKVEKEPALYNEIFKRLDTAYIYSQLFSIYNNTTGAMTYIRPEQLGIAQEEKFAQNALLSVFRNYVRNEQMPLTYRNYNIYEEGEPGAEVTNRTDVSNYVSSAVLLSHIEKAFTLYSNRPRTDRNEWFDYSKTFFGAGKDTFRRIRERALRGENVYIYDGNLLEISGEQKTNEVSLLTQLVHYVHERENETGRFVLNEGDKVFVDAARQIIEKLAQTTVKRQSATLTENVFNKTYTPAAGREISAEDRVYNVRNMYSDRTDIMSSDKNVYMSDRTEIRPQGDSYTDVTDVDMTLVKNTEGDTETDNRSFTTNVDNKDVYKQAIDIINQQNLERLAKLARTESEPARRLPDGQLRVDRSQAILAVQDILSGKSPLEIEYLKEGHVVEKKTEIAEKAVMNVMSEETKQIMNVVREYMENPVKAVTSGKLRSADPGVLAAELHYLEGNATEATAKEPAREALQEKISRELTDAGTTRISETRLSRSEYDTSDVNLVHKHERNFTEAEEIVEELNRQKQGLKKTTEQVQNLTENVNVSRTLVREQTTTTTEMLNSDTVDRMITDRFREDMDEISEKVYDRIEKMLVSERKRRGF